MSLHPSETTVFSEELKQRALARKELRATVLVAVYEASECDLTAEVSEVRIADAASDADPGELEASLQYLTAHGFLADSADGVRLTHWGAQQAERLLLGGSQSDDHFHVG
jgi:hypothetical protein